MHNWSNPIHRLGEISRAFPQIEKRLGSIARSDAERILRDVDAHLRLVLSTMPICEQAGSADEIHAKAMEELEAYLLYRGIVDDGMIDKIRIRISATQWLERRREHQRHRDGSRADAPSQAKFLLHLLLNKQDRQTIPGDLEEEFRTALLPQFGPRRARLWFWSQTLATIATRNPICKWLLAGGITVKLADWVTRRITG